MLVILKHIGYSPILGKHVYRVLTEQGHGDILYESEYFPDGEYEQPSELWAEGTSGWAQYACACGYETWDRFYVGQEYVCPVCGATEIIPTDAVFERSQLDEETIID